VNNHKQQNSRRGERLGDISLTRIYGTCFTWRPRARSWNENRKAVTRFDGYYAARAMAVFSKGPSALKAALPNSYPILPVVVVVEPSSNNNTAPVWRH